jgi:hypothetical protein
MIPYFNFLPCPISAGHILATDLYVIMPHCWFSSGKYFFGPIMCFTEDTVRLNCYFQIFSRFQFSAHALRNHSVSVAFLDRNLFLRLQRVPYREKCFLHEDRSHKCMYVFLWKSVYFCPTLTMNGIRGHILV